MDNFDLNFLSDEDIELFEAFEETFDGFIESIKDDIAALQSHTTVLNKRRAEQFKFAYASLRYLTRGQNVSVIYRFGEPFKTMGSISVDGSKAIFKSTPIFTRAAAFADNIELYPLPSDKARMTLTFHDLTVPIK